MDCHPAERAEARRRIDGHRPRHAKADAVATGMRPGVEHRSRSGPGHPTGSLALADLIGLDVCLLILEVLHRDLGEDRHRPCPLLRKMVLAGRMYKDKRGFYKFD